MIKNRYNQRLDDVFKLLEEAPIEGLKTCLDIGMGDGSISRRLTKKGIRCIGTTLDEDFIKNNSKRYNSIHKIKIIRCNAEKIPLPNQTFDIILMSHVLEHCQNVGLVLQESRRLLKNSGWLLIFVPPYDQKIVAGHVTTGWNIGQLMYILALNGFEVKNGRFLKYGYNICGFVQKNQQKLPNFNQDKGDLEILADYGHLTLDGKHQDSYFGEIGSWNWPEHSETLQQITNNFKYMVFTKILCKISGLFPNSIKKVCGSVLILIGNIIIYGKNYRNVNPNTLKS